MKTTVVILSVLLLTVTACAPDNHESGKPVLIEQPQTVTQPTPPSGKLVVSDTCANIADKLAACEPYACNFNHPFTGEQLQRSIAGIQNDKCVYHEQMPNGGAMDCTYSESQRSEMAQFFRDSAAAETISSEATIDLESGDADTTTMLDGTAVENPLDAALADGTCVISGY